MRFAGKRAAPKGAAGGAQQRKEGGISGQEGKEEEAPPDERTWLQKNWIYLIVPAFMVGPTPFATFPQDMFYMLCQMHDKCLSCKCPATPASIGDCPIAQG